jgi:hypothetical protein
VVKAILKPVRLIPPALRRLLTSFEARREKREFTVMPKTKKGKEARAKQLALNRAVAPPVEPVAGK